MEIYNDFNTTVEKALTEINPDWRGLDGLIVCGQHDMDKTDPEALIRRIQLAREEGQAFLGICFGHQLAAIEYARNVLMMDNATSEEWGDSKGEFIVKKREHLKVGHFEGESYWNWYEVDDFIINNWEKNWNFITCQFHPEYQSNVDHHHPLLVKFLTACGNVE